MAPFVERPPPPPNPFVESWLDSTGMPQPSPAELRQWRINHGAPRNDSWPIVSTTLRTLSLSLALAITVITILTLRHGFGDLNVDLAVAPLVVCGLCVGWDATELVVLRLPRHRIAASSFGPCLDLALSLAAAAATVVIFVDMVMSIGTWSSDDDIAGREFASVALLISLAVVHAVLFFAHACDCIDGRQQPRAPMISLTTGKSAAAQIAP